MTGVVLGAGVAPGDGEPAEADGTVLDVSVSVTPSTGTWLAPALSDLPPHPNENAN
jgi:hypothetical protein